MPYPGVFSISPSLLLGQAGEKNLQFGYLGQPHVVLLDDIRQNPPKEWNTVLRFLGVDGDGRTQFPVHNAAKRVRFEKLRMATRTFTHAKQAMGVPRFHLELLRRIDRANWNEQSNKPISRHLRTELTEYFREDIVLLGELLERDLSGWLSSGCAL